MTIGFEGKRGKVSGDKKSNTGIGTPEITPVCRDQSYNEIQFIHGDVWHESG